MINFYELFRVFILLGSVFLTRLMKSKAWFDFPEFKTSKLVHINSSNQVQIVKNGKDFIRSHTMKRDLTLFIPGCFGWCSTGGGVFSTSTL